MIQSNELRIGNYISCIEIEDEIEITCKTLIFNEEIILYTDELSQNTVKNGFYNISIECADGIIVTEKWLDDFRFEYYHGRYKKGLVTLEFFDDNYLYLTTNDGHKLSMPIIFVHQLQNLYFALTGEELEIK